MLNYYVQKINELLEKPRNELEKKYCNKNNKKINGIIKQYDETLLEKYKYIEKLMEEELSERE